MNRHFKTKDENESYMHACACEILAQWISENKTFFGCEKCYKIVLEEEFKIDGIVQFIPDVTVHLVDNIKLFEIVYKSDLTGYKLHKIQKYFYLNNISYDIYTIKAFDVISKTEFNNRLEMMKFR